MRRIEPVEARIAIALPPGERGIEMRDPVALDRLQHRVRRQALRRQIARNEQRFGRTPQFEQRIDELACRARSTAIDRQQVAQRALARRRIAAQLRQVGPRAQRGRMIGAQFVEHRVGAAGGIRIAQVARRREFLQSHLEARLALEFGKRRIEFAGSARGLEMDQCLARMTASHRQDRKPGLRFGITRRSRGHVAEMHCSQRLEPEIEAQVAECGIELRAIFGRHRLHGRGILQARHRDARGVGIDGGQRPDPGISRPGIGVVDFTRMPGGIQRAAIVALRVQRVGPVAPA